MSSVWEERGHDERRRYFACDYHVGLLLCDLLAIGKTHG